MGKPFHITVQDSMLTLNSATSATGALILRFDAFIKERRLINDG